VPCLEYAVGALRRSADCISGVAKPALSLAYAGEAQVPLESEWSLSSRGPLWGLHALNFGLPKLPRKGSLGTATKGHRFACEKSSC